ncbi:MAG: hypothetical protein GY929_24815 [Actinomycetia bacterium]|nr:hypothetical protein [Actinomycetes bacterium]
MRFIAPALLFVTLSACSVSGEVNIGTPTVENATEDLIESDLADQIGLGDLNASCSKPVSDDVGSRFLCTAVTDGGGTIELQAVIEENGPFVETTNVVLGENLPEIAAILIAEVETQSGLDLADDALDCGTKSLIVNDANEILCQLEDPAGDRFDTTITFNGLDTEDSSFDFFVDTETPSG